MSEAPKNLKYTKEHEWISISDNIATVGITSFAQSELGDIVYIDVHTLGQNVETGDIFGTIEAVKTVSDLFMPVSGEVVEYNFELEKNPELVNSDPFDKGWIIKIDMTNASEIDSLLEEAEYTKLIQ